jgi:RNA polymerase sigma factor (sigma-70 family)
MPEGPTRDRPEHRGRPDEIRRVLDALWRIDGPRILAALTRLLRDVGLAEEIAQEAVLAALERWAETGIPDNPGAWLVTTAKHRAIDRLRHGTRVRRKHETLGHLAELQGHADAPDLAAAMDLALDSPTMGDDLLRLVFISCHPVLPVEARVALTLRLLGGLKTEEIARAFLVPEATVAQRIVRARRTLAEAEVAFEVPAGDEIARRVPSVLGVIYLIFNEGYAATTGAEWMRLDLCEDALRLGRVVVGLVPGEAEAHGLVALMEIQVSRAAARVGPDGAPVLLLDQNRARWDRLLIERGLSALARAEALGPPGPYTLQAAIAACHARARTPADTDWERIVALYAALMLVEPSPVVELNGVVALSMARGPAVGLEALDALATEPALAGYHLLPSVRGDLLTRLGRPEEAAAEFERAAALTRNARERAMLLARAARCREADAPAR